MALKAKEMSAGQGFSEVDVIAFTNNLTAWINAYFQVTRPGLTYWQAAVALGDAADFLKQVSMDVSVHSLPDKRNKIVPEGVMERFFLRDETQLREAFTKLKSILVYRGIEANLTKTPRSSAEGESTVPPKKRRPRKKK
jgi:hypothetical protein